MAGAATLSEQETEMWELVQEMVERLVERPDEVRVSAEPGNAVLLLRVSVAPRDLGKVIGKDGRMARALRTIVGAAAVRVGVRCELNIGGKGDACRF